MPIRRFLHGEVGVWGFVVEGWFGVGVLCSHTAILRVRSYAEEFQRYDTIRGINFLVRNGYWSKWVLWNLSYIEGHAYFVVVYLRVVASGTPDDFGDIWIVASTVRRRSRQCSEGGGLAGARRRSPPLLGLLAAMGPFQATRL